MRNVTGGLWVSTDTLTAKRGKREEEEEGKVTAGWAVGQSCQFSTKFEYPFDGPLLNDSIHYFI